MSNVSLAEFAEKVGKILPVISKEFLKHQTEEFYKTKITMPQFVVLDTLTRSGKIKMTDIANTMNVTTAAMTGIVDRLVRDGYVSREHDTEDRRIVNISITAKASTAVKSMIRHRNKIMMKVFGVISQREREEYLKILEHIRDHLKD